MAKRKEAPRDLNHTGTLGGVSSAVRLLRPYTAVTCSRGWGAFLLGLGVVTLRLGLTGAGIGFLDRPLLLRLPLRRLQSLLDQPLYNPRWVSFRPIRWLSRSLIRWKGSSGIWKAIVLLLFAIVISPLFLQLREAAHMEGPSLAVLAHLPALEQTGDTGAAFGKKKQVLLACYCQCPIFVTGMKISISNEAGPIQDDISVFAHKSANLN